jgi:hypothetical protein
MAAAWYDSGVRYAFVSPWKLITYIYPLVLRKLVYQFKLINRRSRFAQSL